MRSDTIITQETCINCGGIARWYQYPEHRSRRWYCPQCKRNGSLNAVAPGPVARACDVCGEMHQCAGPHCSGCKKFYDEDGNPKRTDLRWQECAYDICGKRYLAPLVAPSRNNAGHYRARCCSEYCSRRVQRRADYLKHEKTARTRKRRTIIKSLALSVAFEHLYICHICGGLIDVSIEAPHPDALTMDHLVPLSKGGSDDRSNLAPAHMDCNAARGNRPLLEEAS